jgi:hypothetical protein
MKFKSLDWKSYDCDYSMSGVLQRTKATVEIKFKNGVYKIYRTYNLHRGATIEANNNWYLLVLENGSKDERHEEVESFEAGKNLAEHDYQKYMNELYDGINKYIV